MNGIYEEALAALHSVWNRRWLALGVAWAVCVLGWLIVALVPNTYESKTRIFVQLEDVLAQQVGIGSGSIKRDIERVRETMTSSVNLEKVIRSTRLGNEITTPREMEIAVEALAKQIDIKSEKDNLFEITARSGRSDLSDAENAKLAQDIVQKMIDIFREENLAGGRGEMRETLAFLDQQLAARQKELETAEQKRLAFEATHPQLIGGAQAIAQKLDTASDAMRNVDADLAAAQSALAAIDGQLAGTPRTIVVPGQSGGVKGALAQAEADLAGMKARGLTDSHPDVVALNKQIASLRKQAVTSGDAGGMPNPAYTSLMSIRSDRQATIQALQARKAALQSELTAIAANQSAEPGVAAEAQRISRDYDVLRKQYDKLLQDREELRLRGQVETERNAVKFEVIDPPNTPRTPAAPNRPLLLFGVLFVGIGAGVGVAFAMGQLHSTFATANKLERAFGLPVLGTISFTLTDAARAIRVRRNKQFVGASAALAGLFLILLATEFVQRGSVA
ncbi:chain-length determining protein [Croceicoccus estronivorus]|uniref:XrtA system polysaccharide chain length determinant n=1 Tax=Croceicoccus estronivorus TaxID=1172626 RepID=UPI0008327FE4|nr:XrtA system polysaccharide chain length determinant [Croceicoccus estronivorus]OCC23155.1 chain-length determining protein [Croceicoccus estronivorus]